MHTQTHMYVYTHVCVCWVSPRWNVFLEFKHSTYKLHVRMYASSRYVCM